MIGTIAVLAGSVFKSGIGVGNFLFEAFVEFEQSSGVLFVGGGEPDRAGGKAIFHHNITGNEPGLFSLEFGNLLVEFAKPAVSHPNTKTSSARKAPSKNER